MMSLRDCLRGKLLQDELLARHTYFKIGGPVDYWFEPQDLLDLKNVLKQALTCDMQVFIIGQGSNILAASRGLKGIVIKLNKFNDKTVDLMHSCIEAGSGVNLAVILKDCLEFGLTGGEFLQGIPGSLGGALVMNAGVSAPQSRSIFDIVKEVKVMDYKGKIKTLKKKDIKFGYRTTNLSKFIVLSAVLRLKKADKSLVRKNIEAYKTIRASNALKYPNAGCVFRNPHLSFSAGRIIDLCGLKGKSVGQAEVWKRHANFIINKGNASSRDVLSLMGIIQKEVKKRFGLNLEPEIRIWQN